MSFWSLPTKRLNGQLSDIGTRWRARWKARIGHSGGYVRPAENGATQCIERAIEAHQNRYEILTTTRQAPIYLKTHIVALDG